METIEVLKKDYWSKSDAFVLPLTGLVKDLKYIYKSYFFWESQSINNYHLIVKFFHKNKDVFNHYCKDYIFPVLRKSANVIEIYNCDDGDIFILDMSEWGEDIDMIIDGKYSKMSEEAKEVIKKYHKMKNGDIPVHIYAVLHPLREIDLLGEGVLLRDKTPKKVSPIEYVIKAYDFSPDAAEQIRKGGELGRIYDKDKETLKELCHAE